MSELQPPPPPEDVIEISAEQLAQAVKEVESSALPIAIQAPIRITTAASKTLLGLFALLSTGRVTIQQVRKHLGILRPRMADETANDGGDVHPPSDAKDGDDVPAPADDQDDVKGSAPAGAEDDAAAEPGGDDPKEASEASAPKTGQAQKPAGITDGKKKRPEFRKDGQPYGVDKHGRRGKDDFPDAVQRYFAHPDFDRPGCRCPECDKLRVYLMAAVGGGIRFTGQPQLTATAINREIWRCGDCGTQYPAPLPTDITEDGGTSRVGHSAAATIACSKYLYGTPWARQESFGSLLDFHIPATTQWEHVRLLVQALLPVYRHLFHVAASAYLFFADDTGARIIGLTQEDKTQRTTGKTVSRTGVHTSCVLSELPDGRKIIIYKTAIIHAGELMDEVLRNRPKGLLVPYHMSDGLSANPPTVCTVIEGECNAHAYRKIKEGKEKWPAAYKYISSVYKVVYANDDRAKKEKMTPDQRLALHRDKSLPLMREMFLWMHRCCFKEKTVEPNSNLGKIFEYFLSREYGLTMFCRHPGFPIDNNLCETSQRLVAQHRKNAEYFRSQRGSLAADVVMSLGATAKQAGVNAHHYFVMLQRYRDEVAETPERFLPWNYLATVAALEKAAPPASKVLEVTESEFKDRQRRLKSTKAWGRGRQKAPWELRLVRTGVAPAEPARSSA